MANAIKSYAIHAHLFPGGTFSFTVSLLERRRKLFTEPNDNPRASCMEARQRRPLSVEAMVILPDPVRRLEIE